MTQRDVTWALVDMISYDYLCPPSDNEDVVFGFTHSREINEICADMMPPHTVTPITKAELERALVDYIGRRGIGEEDEATIRRWMANMPDNIAIIEREPFPLDDRPPAPHPCCRASLAVSDADNRASRWITCDL